jgi:hypothetical protein
MPEQQQNRGTGLRSRGSLTRARMRERVKHESTGALLEMPESRTNPRFSDPTERLDAGALRFP